MATFAVNRRAHHDYTMLDTFEAGIVLSGPEVKAAKLGQCSLQGSFVHVDKNGEAWLIGATISPYPPATQVQQGYDQHMNRKLLLHARELKKLIGVKGLTIVPLKMYSQGKSGRVKLEIALARGKKNYEKRETIKKREVNREIRREILS